jgi:choline dehydrogenase-like flavoprotein
LRAIIIGTGAGGAVAARELTLKGFEVIILDAGESFKPFTRHLTWSEPLRRLGVLGSERTITKLFPALNTIRSSKDLVLVRGIATGGSTSISCGNIVRADYGLKEIGLNLNPEFELMEELIGVTTFPRERWRPTTQHLFDTAENLGLNPQPTPKAVNSLKCTSCGLCELGCHTGARWDSRQLLNDAISNGAKLYTGHVVEKLIIEDGNVKGVTGKTHGKNFTFKSDLVILAAGGVGTAEILNNSNCNIEQHLWVDIVLTLGGVSKNSEQLKEPPMVWYIKEEDYILSPYLDILSHYFHKPWRNVSINDRVGVMVKLADEETGAVLIDGNVEKNITLTDHNKLNEAISQVKDVMESSGVQGPFITGVPNGGHLGGTVPLMKEDVENMKPSGLPEGLWIADLSLAPRSQGLPTILLAAALALRVTNQIIKTINLN